MSSDLHTLSGAYAIDALSDEEAQLFQTHLEECQACRDEVRELQQAAAAMGAGASLAPPPALRARVLAAADQLPQLPPKVTRIEAAPSRRWSRRLVAAAVAAVLLLVAGIGVLQTQRDDPGVVASNKVTQVFEASDARTKTVTTDHGKLTVATSPSLGRMAVETDGLESLGDRQVYQLWAVHDGKSVSAGLLEDLGDGAAMDMPAAGTTVAITIEPAGGSKRPTTTPIVAVDPRAV